MWSAGRRVAGRLGQLPWRTAASESSSAVWLVIKGFCAIQVIKSYLFDLTIPMGPSMLPTINLTGDILAVNKVARWRGPVNKGDIVLMISPDNPRKHLAKRILGVEGDAVTYLVDPANSDTSKTVVVPEGHIWVQGDNIHLSNDSRKFGPVPRGLVQGRIICRVWPPENIGLIDAKVNQLEPPSN